MLRLVIYFILGLLLAAGQAELFQVSPHAVDVRIAVLSVLLARSSPRGLGLKVAGLLLGFSARSLEPLGVSLLGGGIAALLVLPLRELVFVQHRLIQGLMVLPVFAGFAVARLLADLLGAAPAGLFELGAATSVLSTAVAAPVLHLLLEQVSRLVGAEVLIARAPAGPGSDLLFPPR